MKNRASIGIPAVSQANPDRQGSTTAELRRPSVLAQCNEGLQSPLTSISRDGMRGQPAFRAPGALRLHPAFNQLNLAGWLINAERQGKPQAVREPILITKSGILVAGFAEWHAAVCAGQTEIDCIEFALNDDEALQLTLALQRPRAAWNDFIRTELALEQEPYFQSKALANQIAGGRKKGLASLPEADHIDVREEIAHLAGVASRTVGNVKVIQRRGHPQLIDALRNDTISINRALKLCQAEKGKQVEELAYFLWQRSSTKTTDQFVDRLRLEKLSGDIGVLLRKLQQLEATKPGSVEIRPGTREKTVILMGKGHLSDLKPDTGSQI